MLEQRPGNPSLSAPMVDLTADSSIESSTGSNDGLQVVQGSTPVEKRQKLQHDSPPVTFASLPKPTSQQQNSNSATLSPPTVSTAKLPSSSASSQKRNTYCATSSPAIDSSDKFTGLSSTNPGTTLSSPEILSPKGIVHPSQSASLEPHSSYPSLFLPAQPVVDDSETVKTSLRSKTPTKFFGDPLRYSVKLVDEDQVLASERAPGSSSSPRKPLIRDRFQTDSTVMSSTYLAQVNETPEKD